MQLIFAVLLLLCGSGGSLAGFKYLAKTKASSCKRRLIYIISFLLAILALTSLAYILITFLLISGIK